MSNEAAAFFANKKKKKKTFKFNANKVDVSQISSSTHVDAPQVSSEASNAVSISTSTGISVGGDWDEKALSDKLHSSTLINAGGNASGNGTITISSSSNTNTDKILDMKTTYESQLNEKEEIQEKLRVEATRKKLAAAREGMKKQEEKLKEEAEAKKRKEQERLEAQNAAAAASATTSSGIGGKWVPSRMRSSAGAGIGGSRPIGLGRHGIGGQINTTDEELFPDLATADKLMKKEEEQKQLNAAKAKQSTKSAWGLQKNEEKEEEPKVEESKETLETQTTAPTPAPVSENETVTATAPATAPVTAASVAEALKKKPKKKKKDLSTFKV